MGAAVCGVGCCVAQGLREDFDEDGKGTPREFNGLPPPTHQHQEGWNDISRYDLATTGITVSHMVSPTQLSYTTTSRESKSQYLSNATYLDPFYLPSSSLKSKLNSAPVTYQEVYILPSSRNTSPTRNHISVDTHRSRSPSPTPRSTPPRKGSISTKNIQSKPWLPTQKSSLPVEVDPKQLPSATPPPTDDEKESVHSLTPEVNIDLPLPYYHNTQTHPHNTEYDLTQHESIEIHNEPIIHIPDQLSVQLKEIQPKFRPPPLEVFDDTHSHRRSSHSTQYTPSPYAEQTEWMDFPAQSTKSQASVWMHSAATTPAISMKYRGHREMTPEKFADWNRRKSSHASSIGAVYMDGPNEFEMPEGVIDMSPIKRNGSQTPKWPSHFLLPSPVHNGYARETIII